MHGLADELDAWRRLGGEVSPRGRSSRCSSARRSASRGAGEAGRVAVLDLLRARTRRFEVVFVLGLEEGALPRRTTGSPFLDEERQAELEERSRGGRLAARRPGLARPVPLLHGLHAAARRLYLVREAATDDGARSRRARSGRRLARALRRRRGRALDAPAAAVRARPGRSTRRRPSGSACGRSPSLAAAEPEPAPSARAGDRLGPAARAGARGLRAPDPPQHPAVLEELREQTSFSVTELEQFGDCSSMWLIERVVQPRTIDAEIDARLRGSVAHQALYRFFRGLPKRFGADRVDPDALDEAIEFLHECLARRSRPRPARPPELERLELRGGPRARSRAVRPRRRRSRRSPLVPQPLRGLVRLRALGARAAARARSRRLHRLRQDRPDRRRPVLRARHRAGLQVGKTAHSAAQIETERRLQIPLYMLALRDLVGIEPLGGLYRSLSGEGGARAAAGRGARRRCPASPRNDYLDEEAFWGQIERAQEHARAVVERIRDGRRPARPEGRLPCRLVRPLADVPGEAT